MKERIKKIISEMTLEEKAALCSGKNFWYLKGLKRLEIPSVMVTDGPHGLRKQAGSSDHLGINESVAATCFPPAVAAASSWNLELLKKEGEAIGEEAAAEEVAVVLGPGVNMKRSPLCGRNFEYFSEDPFLAGEMSAAWVKGVQSRGIGTSLKHFAANNQEKARLVGNSVVDERALREIYLSAFEKTVKQAQPWTLMCSYNRINNVYSCENKWLLSDVLRDEWGFEGLVMTDWGAMNDRVKALEAGLELEMPGPDAYNDRKIAEAVRNGALEESVLDQAVERLLTLIFKASEVEKKDYNKQAHHALARQIAAQSCVLLKNEGMLPLDRQKNYAVVGAFAKHPRYQGAGSSRINPHSVDVPLDELSRLGIHCTYVPGYGMEDDAVQEMLLQEAKRVAQEADGVIVFAGLPASYESEGFDRTHLNMPESHNALIEAVSQVNSHVTVVLMCGSAVLMPWRDKVESILLAYLGGEAAGGACADVLGGRVNPAGRLAETFPLRMEDVPCFDTFATDAVDVEYRESIFIGYRYYDWAKKEVAYPFGYGLSYTTFSYDALEVEWDIQKGCGRAVVTVTNTGAFDGDEVVQIYVGKEESLIMRAPRELKGFSRVSLKAGETKTVSIPLDERSFSYFDTQEHAWRVEEGDYRIYAGASSRDLRLVSELTLCGKRPSCAPGYRMEEVHRDGRFAADQRQFAKLFGGSLPLTDCGKRTVNTRLGDVLADERGRQIFGGIIEAYCSAYQGEDEMSKMMQAMVMDMPLRGLALLGGADYAQLEKLLEEWNA